MIDSLKHLLSLKHPPLNCCLVLHVNTISCLRLWEGALIWHANTRYDPCPTFLHDIVSCVSLFHKQVALSIQMMLKFFVIRKYLKATILSNREQARRRGGMSSHRPGRARRRRKSNNINCCLSLSIIFTTDE